MKLEKGQVLVEIARGITIAYLKKGRLVKPHCKENGIWRERAGLFVATKKIMKINEKRIEKPILSVGYPLPLMSIADATIDSAINMAIRLKSHSLVDGSEIENSIFEVSVLTTLKLVQVDKPTQYLRKIRIGCDGLMVKKGFLVGLLLPQVPLEEGWEVEDFLSECCIRAGLSADSWLSENIPIYRFQSQIFKEVEPKGKVVEVILRSNCLDHS